MHVPPERFYEFREAHKIYRAELFLKGERFEPVLCTLHDAFGTANSASHNCLGCNFADLTIAFDPILASLADVSDMTAACATYLLWLYLFVERYDQIMVFLSVPDGYKKRHFLTLQRIRRWANFIKHPKAFLFCHHPQFFHGGEVGEDFTSGPGSLTINQEFIDEYYSGKEHNAKLAGLLSNATDVTVVYPGPARLMEQFAAETRAFATLIEKNEVYREELGKITTVAKYYEAFEETKEGHP